MENLICAFWFRFFIVIFLFHMLCKGISTWCKSKISSCCFFRRQGECKIRLCNPGGGKLLLRPSASYNKYCEESHLETCQSSLSLNTLTIFSKKPHCRGSRWGVGRLQVHGICSCRLVHSEVVEAWSNSKRSCLSWFRNLACGDSIGSNRIEIH